MKDVGETFLIHVINVAKTKWESGDLDVEEFVKDCYPKVRETVLYREYLTPKQVADLYPGITTGILRQLRLRNEGPPYTKLAPGEKGRILYSSIHIKEWLESRATFPTKRKSRT